MVNKNLKIVIFLFGFLLGFTTIGLAETTGDITHNADTTNTGSINSTQGEIKNEIIGLNLTTVEKNLPFEVKIPVTNNDIFEFNDTGDSVLIKENANYNLITDMTFSFATEERRTVTVRGRKVSDDSLIYSRDFVLESETGSLDTISSNTLLTIGMSGFPSAEFEIYFTVESDGTGISIYNFNTIMSSTANNADENIENTEEEVEIEDGEEILDDDSDLPQIEIDEETNTIYITGDSINSGANNTGEILDEDVLNQEEVEIDEVEEISDDDEFTNALAWMYANGLTMYDNKDEFRPKDYLTREEASKIIGQAYSVLGYNVDLEKNTSCVFSDEAMFNETLKPHIENVCKRGLFKGSDGKFMPQDTLTKAQSMAVLVRMFEQKMSYELQTPWWAQYYEKGKIMGLTSVDNINEFDHELSRYEIALMIYRLKKLVSNDQLKTMALNALNNIEVETSTGTMDAETVIENLNTLVGGIDPNTDPELLEAIYWMYDNGLTIYKTPTEYNPFGTLTKAGAAKIFDKFSDMLGLGVDENYLPNDCEFTDIEDVDSTTKVHILNVCKKGLIKGSNGLFSPDETINKSHFIVALIRMFEGKHLDETTSPRWQNYFDEAQELGLVSTSDSVTFDTPISRYEVALFVYKFDIKYKMLNNLNNNTILNEIITTVEGSIGTGEDGNLKANVYVDANLLKDGNFDVGYIEILGTRYKIVKSSEETYFTDNFVRYGNIFDMVTDEALGSVNFLVSNGYVIEGAARFTEGTNYKISGIEGTNAYYEINEQ